MTAHTPEPWHHSDVISSPSQSAEKETLANARLIAASPDLLAACEAIVAYQTLVDSGADTGLLAAYMNAFEGAEAAINKARGE